MNTPDIGAFHTSITPVGSRVTCNPAPTDTDADWLVLVPRESFAAFLQGLLDDGWEDGGSLIWPDESSAPAEAFFVSMRKGQDNIVSTYSNVFHQRFLAATSVAKRLNLLDKDDRIAVFRAVLYAEVGTAIDPRTQVAIAVMGSQVAEVA